MVMPDITTKDVLFGRTAPRAVTLPSGKVAHVRKVTRSEWAEIFGHVQRDPLESSEDQAARIARLHDLVLLRTAVDAKGEPMFSDHDDLGAIEWNDDVLALINAGLDFNTPADAREVVAGFPAESGEAVPA